VGGGVGGGDFWGRRRSGGGEVAEGYAPYMGMVGGRVLGGEGRVVAEGYAPYLGVGYCREGVF
jgi:hypothetical protein